MNDHPPPDPNYRPLPDVINYLLAGGLTYESLAARLRMEAFAGLEQHCEIPARYSGCELDYKFVNIAAMSEGDLNALGRSQSPVVLDPHESQLKAILFFQMLLEGHNLVCEQLQPLRPRIGAYLVGPPGTAKTHLMAAAAKRLKQLLAEKLKSLDQIAAREIGEAFDKFNTQALEWGNLDDRTTRLSEKGVIPHPADTFMAALDAIREKFRTAPHKPTDILYLGFEELCAMYETDKAEVITAIEQARMVFIDDVHPGKRPERLQIVHTLIERRYELGRPATFFTSNDEPGSLGGEDDNIKKRLDSRLSTMLIKLDFAGAEDWRKKVHSRRVTLVSTALEKRLSVLKATLPKLEASATEQSGPPVEPAAQ